MDDGLVTNLPYLDPLGLCSKGEPSRHQTQDYDYKHPENLPPSPHLSDSLFLSMALLPKNLTPFQPENRTGVTLWYPACLLAYWKITQIRRLRQQSFGTQLNKSSLLSLPSVFWSIPLVEPASFFKGCSCCCDGVLGNAKGGAWSRARERFGEATAAVAAAVLSLCPRTAGSFHLLQVKEGHSWHLFPPSRSLNCPSM